MSPIKRAVVSVRSDLMIQDLRFNTDCVTEDTRLLNEDFRLVAEAEAEELAVGSSATGSIAFESFLPELYA